MGSQHARGRVGLVELREPYNPETAPQLAKGELRQIFRKEHWLLDKGKLAPSGLQELLPAIREARITILNLEANNEQGLPAALARVAFPALQRLRLSGNAIASIEHLVFLRADHLVELALSWNYIASTRPLRKCRFPRLKYLNLEENNAQGVAEDVAYADFPELREVCL